MKLNTKNLKEILRINMTVNVRHWKATTGRNNPVEVEEEIKPVSKKRDSKGRYIKKKKPESLEEALTEN